MKRLFVSIAALALVVGCAVEAPTGVESLTPEFSATGSSQNPGDKSVTVPFKADFYTEQVGELVLDGSCGSLVGVNTQAGMGEATHLGRFTTWMVFCFNVNPPPDLGKYWFVPGVGGENGRFVAANGDELWITVVDGFVDFFDPTLPPGYQASFNDEFSFIGGTGRFEGASGGGWTTSLVGVDGRTEHEWTGELTMTRGRR